MSWRLAISSTLAPRTAKFRLTPASAAQPEIDESELLLRRADSRLYKAKTNGRNRVELAD